MSKLKHVERGSFAIAVLAGAICAIAGGVGWTTTSIIAGCAAAAAQIGGRAAGAKVTRAVEAHATEQVARATQAAAVARDDLQKLQRRLGPRIITVEQSATLKRILGNEPSFPITVAFNRHEAEPTAFRNQLAKALEEAGLSVSYFGGMTNSTLGVEISGRRTPEKDRLMLALLAANIPFQCIEFTPPDDQREIEVWVGQHPGLAQA